MCLLGRPKVRVLLTGYTDPCSRLSETSQRWELRSPESAVLRLRGFAGDVAAIRLVYLVSLSWHVLVAAVSFAMLPTRASNETDV